MRCALVLSAALAVVVQPLAAQGRNSTEINNLPYDGRFTYARIYFESSGAGNFGFGRSRIMWNHDYTRSDRTLPLILSELTSMKTRFNGSQVFASDDPQLLRYPVAYICEVGSWRPSDAEAAGMRNYLLKGGFLIVDDFGGGDIDNFAQQLQRVLPGARILPLAPTHPIFDSFYRIGHLSFPDSYRGEPQFMGVFQDNDPAKRLLMVLNYNFDVSEYWEWSSTGSFAIAPTNEAFKLGVNYVMYTLTH